MSGQSRFLWRTSSSPARSFLLRISQVQDKQVSPFPSCSTQDRNFDVNTLPLLWTGDLLASCVALWCGCPFLQVQAWISPAHLFYGPCFATPLTAMSAPVSWMHTVQETKWDAEREKACINTYAHASASQICLHNLCGQQQNSPMADPTFGSKSGPQNRAQAKT